MQKVVFYTRESCLLCEEALHLLKLFQTDYRFDIEVRDIETNDSWMEEYQLEIPVLEMNKKQLMGNKANFNEIMQFLEKNINGK